MDMDRDQAAQLFVDRVTIRAYDGVIDDVTSLLKDGPPGRKPDPELIRLHQWFSQLGEQDKEMVERVIREAAEASVFGVFTVLDGVSGGYPIPDTWSDSPCISKPTKMNKQNETMCLTSR